MRIAIIGSNPSKFNTNPDIPFVGTRSHTRLKKWISYLCSKTGLQEANFALLNVSRRVSDREVSFTENELGDLYYASLDYDYVISLGENVRKACNKVGVFNYSLPHPSFKNRKLNNPEDEKKFLDELASNIRLMSTEWNNEPDYSVVH